MNCIPSLFHYICWMVCWVIRHFFCRESSDFLSMSIWQCDKRRVCHFVPALSIISCIFSLFGRWQWLKHARRDTEISLIAAAVGALLSRPFSLIVFIALFILCYYGRPVPQLHVILLMQPMNGNWSCWCVSMCVALGYKLRQTSNPSAGPFFRDLHHDSRLISPYILLSTTFTMTEIYT